MSLSSVRVRVTAVAVVVTAVALAIGGWGLLRSIESTQLGRIAAATERQVDDVVRQLASGVPATQLRMTGDPGALGLNIVQILDTTTGDVVTASPTFAEQPLVVVSDVGPSGVAAGQVLVGGGAGSARVEEPLPGLSERATEFELRYERVSTPDGRNLTVVAASPLAEVTRSLDAVRRSLWIGLPAVVVLVGVIAWFVTGRALDPVEAMRLEVESITHSTLHRRVPEPGTTDEIGRLARTMNAMLDRLERSADRQRRFVADASHELRTPVATMRTELEVALAAGDLESLRTAVEGALQDEHRLETMLADLLLLTSLEEGRGLGTEEVDLGALAGAAAERPRAVPVTARGTGTVVGSHRALEQVVTNLLDNAARHARSQVVATVEGGRLVVEDDGPGIAVEDRERVFERFTRLDEARARDDGGAGLGLSIVRAVVSAHGGTVAVDGSPSLGGARFTVALPDGTARTAAAPLSGSGTPAIPRWPPLPATPGRG